MKTFTTFLISLISFLTVKAKVNFSNPAEASGLKLVSGTVLAAGANDNKIVLTWSGKKGAGKSYFEIERSFYSNNFNTIAVMQVPFTSNSISDNFRIFDKVAELEGRAIVYYRIKQVEAATGVISYSNVMVVSLENSESCAVKKNKSIRFAAAQNGNAVIKIQSLTGQVMAMQNTIISRGNNIIELEKMEDLPKGIFISAIIINGVVVDNQKIIVE